VSESTSPQRHAQPGRNRRQTQDEKLLAAPRQQEQLFTHTDPWRVLRILGEFVEGFDTLAELGPAVSIFGSARTSPDDPQYLAAVETARLLAEAGLVVITGGGPGIMQAGNQGAKLGNGQYLHPLFGRVEILNYFGQITSIPPIQGRSTSGTTTEPSGC